MVGDIVKGGVNHLVGNIVKGRFIWLVTSIRIGLNHLVGDIVKGRFKPFGW